MSTKQDYSISDMLALLMENLYKHIFITAIFLVGINAHSQNQILIGKLIDNKTSKGIIAATITISAKVGSISDPGGYFSINVTKYPVKLTISHVSYGAQSFTLNYHPNDTVVFLLEEIRTHIPEILVSGKKLQVLTQNADYSVFKMEFDKYYLWFIGMIENRPKKTRLFLANLIGDTLASLPIDLPATFKKDIFGYVHLETIDSVFQLSGIQNQIRLLHGERRDTYFKIMGGYQATLGNGLVYFMSYPNLHESHLYFIDSTMPKPKSILELTDQPDDLSWLPGSLKQLGNYLGARTVNLIVSQQRGYFRETRSESIFKIQDSLYLVDLNNDKLHTINPSCELISSVPISFHYQPNPTITNLFLHYDDFLVDPLNNNVYITYHNNNHWRFVPFDPETGETSSEIEIPRYNAMTNIRIHGGAIYFIYPEKVYPFYQRIYRKILKTSLTDNNNLPN